MNDKSAKEKHLTVDLSDPLPIPDDGIARALEIMKSGRLFRYGEFAGGASEVARLEQEFAQFMSCKYAVAMNSCGSTMFVALKCAGVTPGDPVLVNAFTLAPVPGAIEHAGGAPVFVECRDDYSIDLDDLAEKASGPARVLLLSHMRGHIADMAAILEICDRHNVMLIEDCAHTLGARWNDRLSGSFGKAACFSLQTFKHINAGEGGILTTDDEDLAAKAILYSGSYTLYAQNGARPALTVFERYKRLIPNYSLRMPELTAAVARPQLAVLQDRAEEWAGRYRQLEQLLDAIPQVHVPGRESREAFIGSSIQFSITGLGVDQFPEFLDACRARGLDIKWFGRSEPQGFTSSWEDWRYVGEVQKLPRTHDVLERLCDMRIPVSISEKDCRLIAGILGEELSQRA